MGENIHEELASAKNEGFKHSLSDKSTLLDDKEDDLRCGYFGWKPDWLQKYNTPPVLAACISWYLFAQCFVLRGVIAMNIATWERIYGFDSRQTAWIFAFFDICNAFFTLAYGYLSRFVSNAKLLSFGAFSVAIGSFITLSVHFLSDPYEIGQLDVAVCVEDGPTNTPKCHFKHESKFFALFLLGQFFHSIGGAPAFAIAISYIDRQLKPQDTPLYIGVMHAIEALGFVTGCFTGSAMLRIYVDFDKGGSVDLEPSDPRWAGAWWVAYAFSTTASLSAAILLACFPADLPNSRLVQSERQRELHVSLETRKDGSETGNLKHSLKSIFMNPVWVFTTIVQIVEGGMLMGLAAFTPKIIQHQFGTSTVVAGLVSGAIVVPGVVIGKILGGLIPKLTNMKMKGLLLQSIVFSALGVFTCVHILLRCPTPSIAGVTIGYQGSALSHGVALDAACNAGCRCSAVTYDPVCGADGIQYLTPCHAGCPAPSNSTSPLEYHDCSCITGANNTVEHYAEYAVATQGNCREECDLIYAFVFLVLLSLMATFIAEVPSHAAVLRSLSEPIRPLALAIQGSSRSIIGHAPKMYLLGYILDSTCLLWQESCDEEIGACWIYDSYLLARNLFIVLCVVRLVCVVCYTLSWVLYKQETTKELTNTEYISLDSKN